MASSVPATPGPGPPVPTVTPRRLAPGAHEAVLTTNPGSAPIAFACRRDPGRSDGYAGSGQAWDLTTAQPCGPEIPGLFGQTGAFGLGRDPGGGTRALALRQARHGVEVLDAFTGATVAELTSPVEGSCELLCLAVVDDRDVVVAVVVPSRARYRSPRKPCVVWDLETGTPRDGFEVWFPDHGVGDPRLLSASPGTGAGVLLTSSEERGDPGGSQPFIYDVPLLTAIDAGTGEPVATVEGYEVDTAVGVTPDGPVVAYRPHHHLPVLEEVELPGLAVATFPGLRPVTTLATPGRDGDRPATAVGTVAGRGVVVAGEHDRRAVTAWTIDQAQGRPVRRVELPAPIAPVTGLAVAADGTVLVATEAGLEAVPPVALLG